MTEDAVEAAAAAGAGLLRDLGDPWSGLPRTARTIALSALESFAERGFHATTLKHIAAGPGLSTAALYVHFDSKMTCSSRSVGAGTPTL